MQLADPDDDDLSSVYTLLNYVPPFYVGISMTQEDLNSKYVVKQLCSVLVANSYCYIMSVHLFSGESWIISLQMNKRLEATKMWFLRQMLRMTCTKGCDKSQKETTKNCC